MSAGADVTLGAGAGAPRFALGRVHELCGPDRRSLAVMLAGAAQGPVLWIRPAGGAERLHAAGVAPFCAPGRIVFVDAPRPVDLLWSAEEALRDCAAATRGGVVVAELSDPPGLTPVRRLHLAAGPAAGGPDGLRSGGAGLPLGLLLVPGDGGAAGVEGRWHLAPCASDAPCPAPRPAPRPARWRLERRRARGAGPAAWRVEADGAGRVTLLRQAAPTFGASPQP